MNNDMDYLNMNNKQLWKVFKLNNKEICSYTIYGTFKGEEEATKKMIAFDHNCSIDDILVSIELR